MDIALASLATLLLGLAVGWLIRRSQVPDDRLALAALRQQHAAALDELATTRTSLAAAVATEHAMRDQIETIRGDREVLVDQFKAQAGEVLTERSRELARQAEAARTAQEREAAGDLVRRTAAIDALVKPLAEQLGKFGEKVDRLEGERKQAAGAFEAQLRALGEGVGALGKNAQGLVTALRKPNVRGAWGELQLVTAFEHAGLVEGVNFSLQHTVAGDAGNRLRPDAVVHLPGDKSIAVDAKVPFAAYQEACDATDPDEIAAHMLRHAGHVRTHIRTLAGKDYRAALVAADHATPDFVVMFIPSEAMYFAALEADPSLLTFAIEQKVFLAAPMSLISILQAVHVGWQQERIADGAREIAAIATELHKRFGVFFEHFDGMGRSLGKAVEKYNAAAGSFDRSLLPQFRRLEDHQIKSARPTPAVEAIDVAPRHIARGLTVELGTVGH